ncbi:unnamed protein product [Pleuronectes platessa]|uniref:Uncharacterized protein n=1 Tax=Pleuronectes platessa TaxID=8262 RepID=A0A9N7VSW4_PLEPL|nr:unnamed protein product [Pleuronectes platessa]
MQAAAQEMQALSIPGRDTETPEFCQYVNEGAAAVGGSVGWHLPEKQPPFGTHISLHQDMWWETGRGAACELQWEAQESSDESYLHDTDSDCTLPQILTFRTYEGYSA